MASKALAKEKLVTLLEETAQRLGIILQYQNLSPFQKDDTAPAIRSGSFIWKGKSHILIEKNLSPEDKSVILTRELSRFDLESIFLPPVVREHFSPLSVKKPPPR